VPALIALPDLPARPLGGPRRVLVAVRRTAIASAIARLAERADVEIAVARTPGLTAADFAAHENVRIVGDRELFAALAASHLLIADAPAARAAAAALGVPTIEPGVPAAVLQQSERILDDDAPPRPIRLAA
jgi:hypothetical protein